MQTSFTLPIYELKSAATAQNIPARKKKRNNSQKSVQDHTLSHLAMSGKSRCAFHSWKQAGRPRSGVLYDERRKYKRDVAIAVSKLEKGKN